MMLTDGVVVKDGTSLTDGFALTDGMVLTVTSGLTDGMMLNKVFEGTSAVSYTMLHLSKLSLKIPNLYRRILENFL